MAQRVVDQVEVEVHLTGVVWLEGADLELHHHVATQLEVVEEQVQIEIILVHRELVLSADKSEADAELHQERLEVSYQAGFELALSEGLGEGQEVEDVGILEGLPRQIGLGRWQPLFEVGHRRPLPSVGLTLDHQGQTIAAPALREDLLHVPAAGIQVFDLLDQDEVVTPRELKNECAKRCMKAT